MYLCLIGLLGCFHLLAIVDNGVVNKGVPLSIPVLAFSLCEFVARCGTAGSYGNFIFIYLFIFRDLHTVFYSCFIILLSHQQCTGFQFLYTGGR